MRLISPIIFILLFSSCSILNTQGVRSDDPILRAVWTKNLDPDYNTGNLPIALHGPAYHNGMVFSGQDSGKMNAYDLRNGRLLWQEQDNSGYHSYPAVHDDVLIYGTRQGRVFARNYLTGELLYAVDLDAPIESPPVIHEGRAFFHLRNHKIFALDFQTGQILWAYQRSVPFSTTIQGVSTPLVDQHRLIVGFADGSLVALNLEDGIILWERRLGEGTQFVDVDISPVRIGDFIVAASLAGEMKLINPTDGMVIRRVGFTPSRSPMLLNNGEFLVGSKDGNIYLLDRDYEVVSELDLGRFPITGYLPWKGGFVVTMAAGDIFWVDRQLKEKKTAFSLGHAHSSVLSRPIIADGKLALMSSRHRLYIFQ